MGVRIERSQHAQRFPSCGRRPSAGLTLIELIVVLAILALMSAIAIPTLARLGFFARNEVQNSARELYAMLRAAKIYAATYHVDTGIAYGVSLKPDSVTGQVIETIDAIAMVYKLPREIQDLCVDLPSYAMTTGTYVPVVGEQERGFFRPLPKDTGMLAENLLPGGTGTYGNYLHDSVQAILIFQPQPTYDQNGNRKRELACEPVMPLLLSDDLLSLLPSRLQYLAALPAGQRALGYGENTSNLGFPAHVFTPSGRLLTSGIERFRIYVGYAPDASPVERFADPANPDRTPTMEGGNIRSIPIELYRGTGRVTIVRD